MHTIMSYNITLADEAFASCDHYSKSCVQWTKIIIKGLWVVMKIRE